MKKVVFVLLTAGICLAAWLFIEPRVLTTARYQIDRPGTTPVRIAFLTDIHHGPFLSRERVRQMVSRTLALKPDIVLLGGDYVHRDPMYIGPVFEELARVSAAVPAIGVLGNHDHWESAAMTRSAMKKAGIEILDNRVRILQINGGKIRLAGLSDYREDVPDSSALLADTNDGVYTVLVTHNPDALEKLPPAALDKADLALCGHTHGGQITLFGLWAPLVPSYYGQKYRTGLINKGRSKVIISNGIGTITPPLRFFAPPQIVTVDLI